MGVESFPDRWGNVRVSDLWTEEEPGREEGR